MRRLHRLPGDATLVVRHDVTHEADIGTFTAFDLYADDGRYYNADSLAGLRVQVADDAPGYDQSSPRVLRAFARAAGDSPAQARRAVLATQPRSAVTPQPSRRQSPRLRRLAARNVAHYPRSHHGHPPPRWTFRAYLDSYLWIVATQALQAGAGRPQVRAGAMQVLASLGHTTETTTRLEGRPVLRVRFDNLGTPETVWLTDGTGIPLREVDGSGPDAALTTYHVRRVSLAPPALSVRTSHPGPPGVEQRRGRSPATARGAVRQDLTRCGSPRALLLALALLACGWFAVGIRQAHETDAAAAIVAPGATSSTAALDHARALIDSGGFLYPGQTVALLRAQQLIARRRFARAARVTEKIVRAEPQNLEGWIDLAVVFIRAPRVGARTGITPAQIHRVVARLDPVDARHR